MQVRIISELPIAITAQRIVRAKAKMRDAQVLYEVPSRAKKPERLEAVLQVIYLVFNEGYTASSGEHLTRKDLSSEGIRLGRLFVELLPEPEAVGLLALMLLHDSRRTARTSREGDLILLQLRIELTLALAADSLAVLLPVPSWQKRQSRSATCMRSTLIS